MDASNREALIVQKGYRADIAGDTLSLYLSNNPAAAMWLAHRIGDPTKIALELCCAVGVTLEHLAPVFQKVIGVDIDTDILNACKENIQRAGHSENVELILGDVTDEEMLESIQADVVIYDIPYWYPEKYTSYSSHTVAHINPDLESLVSSVRHFISHDIVIFAPKEMGYEYFTKALGECECIEVFINNKHDRNYLFFGGLIEQTGTHTIHLKM